MIICCFPYHKVKFFNLKLKKNTVIKKMALLFFTFISRNEPSKQFNVNGHFSRKYNQLSINKNTNKLNKGILKD